MKVRVLIGALFALVLCAALPAFAGPSVVDKVTTLLIYMLLAAMWGLMAGQANLISVGQQAWFGLGGYFALRLVEGGLGAWPALAAGALGAAVVAWLLSFYVLRLKDGEFAIATWVLAEVVRICVMLDPLVQGETGTSLLVLNSLTPELRRTFAYWFALAALAIVLAAMHWLLSSSVGSATRAIGEDEEAAAALGVRVMPTKRVIFVLAAFGSALAGVAWLASAITFLPRTNFGVQWSVLMLFMVLVGGLRSTTGPLLGAVLLFALEELAGDYGTWYLAGLGAVAAAFALWLPDGLMGAWERWRGRRRIQTQTSPQIKLSRKYPS